MVSSRAISACLGLPIRTMTSSTARCSSILPDAMNPTYPYDRLNGSYVKNGAASQINPPAALLQERNDTKNMNFNAHLKLNYDILDRKLSDDTAKPFSERLYLTAFGSYS